MDCPSSSSTLARWTKPALGGRQHFAQPARHFLQLLVVDAVPKVVKPLMVDFLAAEFCQPVVANRKATLRGLE